MDTIKSTKKTYELLDLAKLILAILIVAIHAELKIGFLLSFLRMAVPVFFMISSYLFFLKLNNTVKDGHKKLLANFVLKNLKLFGIWTLILSPVVIYSRRDMLSLGFKGVLKAIYSMIMGSTFSGSWFLIALILAVVIIYFLSKKLNTSIILLIAFSAGLIAVFHSSYLAFIPANSVVTKAFVGFETYLFSPARSVVVGLMWVAIGKMFADGKFKIKKIVSIICLVASAGLLILEWWLLMHFTGADFNDCYLLLVPVALFTFSLILDYKSIKIPHAKSLRKMSTIMYVFHGAVVSVLRVGSELILKKSFPVVNFLGAILASLILALLIIWLERYKAFKWLKNLY